MKISIFDNISPNSFMQEFTEPYDSFDEELFERTEDVTDEQIYNNIPECPLCGCLQGAENIKLCQKHYLELLNKIN
jgi:hypothetical protein